MRSSLVKRTLPPTLTKGMRRCCCRRRTLATEILSSSATSVIVSSSTDGQGSVDIFFKEQHRAGDYTGEPYKSIIDATFRHVPILHVSSGPHQTRGRDKEIP